MKKLVSILLALALILSLSVTAFATTLTIADGEAARTYDGYKLLNLTVSPKTGTHPEGCDGTNHKDGCYNYSYTVNAKYRTYLQNEAFEHAEEDFWGEENTPTVATGVTDDQILRYLTSLSSDNDNGYGTLRDAADRIYRAIKDASVKADKSEMSGTNDVIDQGYWMIADVSTLTGNESNSLVMVDTKGASNITVQPKTGLPTLEKKVKDVNDSTGETTDWQDSADYDIGDTVPFKLTATLPENLAGYDTYKIIFHDTLEGLTLKEGSVKVYMYASAEDAAAANIPNDPNHEVTGFTTNTDDDCSFDVLCGNVLAIDGVDKDTVFVVYYEATLNTGAEIGEAGNPNEVYLEFSNNPYTDGTGNTEKDEVIVYTYQLTINKTDADGEALKGAGFTLYKKDANGNYTPIVMGKDAEGKDVTELTGADMTTFEWKGLDDGDYKLVETTVPDGFNKMEDIEFTITAEHDEEAEEPKLTRLTSTLGEANTDEATGALTGVIEEDIINQTGTVLPETGAKGTFMLITISTMIVMAAVVFMVTRKKMSIYED